MESVYALRPGMKEKEIKEKVTNLQEITERRDDLRQKVKHANEAIEVSVKKAFRTKKKRKVEVDEEREPGKRQNNISSSQPELCHKRYPMTTHPLWIKTTSEHVLA